MSKPVIAVVTYSTYGHVDTLAASVIKGVEAAGAIAKPFAFKETLSEEILSKMYAGKSLNPQHPIITPNDLKEVDGIIIGAPTRYGRVPAQVSAFFDSCGQLWATGALVGKFVTQFTSAAGQHGGHETTALTTMPFYVHQGMVYVPIGYANQAISDLDKVIGGAPYGASTVAAGDGSRQPQESELAVAEYQGKYFAEFVGTFVRGKHLSASSAAAPLAAAATAPAAAKAVPEQLTEGTKETKQEGYAVPDQTGAAPATTTAATTPPTAPATAATAAPAATTAAPKKEKKGGLFASCCGGRGIEN